MQLVDQLKQHSPTLLLLLTLIIAIFVFKKFIGSVASDEEIRHYLREGALIIDADLYSTFLVFASSFLVICQHQKMQHPSHHSATCVLLISLLSFSFFTLCVASQNSFHSSKISKLSTSNPLPLQHYSILDLLFIQQQYEQTISSRYEETTINFFSRNFIVYGWNHLLVWKFRNGEFGSNFTSVQQLDKKRIAIIGDGLKV